MHVTFEKLVDVTWERQLMIGFQGSENLEQDI